jgi:hypothetical protein
MNPTQIGDISEAQVLGTLIKAGLRVLLPFGNNERYDLVIDRGDGKFQRIQVKTGQCERGGLTFRTHSSTTANGKTKKTPYHGQIDAFAVYCRENDTVYIVPIEKCGSNECFLRFDPPKSGQKKGINLASEFIFRG